MHKRQKRKYRIFHTFFKTVNPLLLNGFPFKTIPVTIFFIIFMLTACPASRAFAYGNNAPTPNPALRWKTVYNILSGFVNYYNGNYPASITGFEKETGKMNSDYGNFILASVYYKNENYSKALPYINKAIKLKKIVAGSKKLTPDELDYLILKAKILADNNELKDSTILLKKILKTNPDDLRTLLMLSNIYIYENDTKTAIAYLNLAKLNHPDDMEAYYILFKIYLTMGNSVKAENNLLELIKVNPYFKKAYFELALLYIVSKKENKALNILKKYLNVNPYSRDVMYQVGILNYSIKNYNDAVKYFSKVANMTGNGRKHAKIIRDSYFFAGISYFMLKNYPKSLYFLNKIKSGKHYVNSMLTKIEIYLVYYQIGKSPKYGNLIKESVGLLLSDKSLKKNLKTYYFSAIAMSNIDDYPASANILLKGLKYFPKNTRLLYQLGSVYHSMKKFNKADETMDKILKIDPDNEDALNYKGYFLAVSGKDLKQARVLIEKALSIDGKSPYILDSMGFILYRYKKYNKAMVYFKLALKKLGNSSTVLKHVGMDYFMLKDYKNALKYLEKSYSIKKVEEVKNCIKKIKGMLENPK